MFNFADKCVEQQRRYMDLKGKTLYYYDNIWRLYSLFIHQVEMMRKENARLVEVAEAFKSPTVQ